MELFSDMDNFLASILQKWQLKLTLSNIKNCFKYKTLQDPQFVKTLYHQCLERNIFLTSLPSLLQYVHFLLLHHPHHFIHITWYIPVSTFTQDSPKAKTQDGVLPSIVWGAIGLPREALLHDFDHVKEVQTAVKNGEYAVR